MVSIVCNCCLLIWLHGGLHMLLLWTSWVSDLYLPCLTVIVLPHVVQVRRLTEQELWAERIQVRKRKEHFIFTIESTGALPPQELFKQALDILAAKCDKLATRL